MLHVDLTDAHVLELAGGSKVNATSKEGKKVTLDGSRLSTSDLAALATGGQLFTKDHSGSEVVLHGLDLEA